MRMITSLASAFTAASLASAALSAPGWGTNALTIESVIPTEDGLTIIVSNNDNPAGCSSPSWMRLRSTDPNYQLISSTVLTAFAQRKTIKIWQGSCEPDGPVHFRAAWVDK